MSLEVGQIIENKYRIVRLLGEGGMGAVYEGENVRINRRVAIKMLHAGFTEDREVTQRFEREAQAAGRIGNDHILEVLDLGSMPGGERFIVMEYLDGEPLSSRIAREKRLTPFQLAPLVRQVLVGLGAAHAAGIVHRDLKPDNVFILTSKGGRPDFVKIIDFGISKFQPLGAEGMKMTRTGVVMGTPYYMSPEQASGSSEADARSDIYSVGVIMFEAVTGQVPFDASTFNELMFKIVLSEVPAPESVVPGLDPAFASIVSKAMARDANVRFQSTEEFIRALDAWLSHGAAVALPSATNAAAPPHQDGTPEAVDAISPLDAPPVKKRTGALVAGIAAVLAGGVAFALLGRKTEAPNPALASAASAVPSTNAPPAANASISVVPLAASSLARTAAPAPSDVAPASAGAPSPSVPASAPVRALSSLSASPAKLASPKLGSPKPAVRPVQRSALAPAAPPAPAPTANKPHHAARDFGY